MNEYRNILTEDTARAFKRLISRFDGADDNDVVKHLIEVHERFCREDCPLEKSNICAQKLEVRAPTISPHEPDEEKRAESTEYHVSDHHEKTMCLQMEVEDGAESVDDDSSGESDSDTESGEEFYIKDEKEFFHEIPCEISTYTISKGSSTMVRKDWSSVKTRSLVKPKSTKPLSSTRQKATHRHTKELNKKGQLTSHTETLNQITLKSGVSEIHSRLDQTDILNPSAGNPSSVRHPEEAPVINNLSQLSCSVKSEPTELSELQGQSSVHPSDIQGIQSTPNFPLGVDQSTRKQVSTSGGDYQESLHTNYVPPVPKSLSSVMPSIQEPLNLTLIINPVTGKPMLVRSPDVTESSHNVNQLNLKLTINPVSGESVLVPDIETQSAAGKSGDQMLSPQMVLSPSSMALPSQAKTPSNDASEDQSENSHIQTVDLPSETDDLVVASKSDCIKRSSCRTSKRRISSTTTASASQNNSHPERFETSTEDEMERFFEARQAMSTRKNAECGIQIIQAIPEIPAEPKPVPAKNKRFKAYSAADLQKFEDACQSKSTKRNTKWGIKLFQDWHTEVNKEPVDFENVSVEVLAYQLRKFYCEAKPKESIKRQENVTSAQFETYHKNTLKNLRSAINRHLQDIGRSIDIVHDKEFRSANRTLNGMLKFTKRSGASRPNYHKEAINKDDLLKISSYFKAASSFPLVLRQCVWFNLSLHFISQGLEFPHKLRMDSFEFLHDEDGKEYIVLRQTTQQQKIQGGLNNAETPADKRLYAVPDSSSCPVNLLRLLMSKTHKGATNLFNICFKSALSCPSACGMWYSCEPLQKQSFYGIMRDICVSAKCQNTYTPQCLRATAITATNEADLEARQIMFISGPRCEGSL